MINGWSSLIISFLYSLFAIYCIIKYAKLSQNEECCNKRRIWIVVDIFLIISALSHQIALLFSPYVYNMPTAQVITVVILFASTFAAMTVFTQQIWLIFYQINLSKAVKKEKWQKIINNQLNTNWFIKHTDTYGSKRFSFKIAITYCSTSN